MTDSKRLVVTIKPGGYVMIGETKVTFHEQRGKSIRLSIEASPEVKIRRDGYKILAEDESPG